MHAILTQAAVALSPISLASVIGLDRIEISAIRRYAVR
jgi:hypothetical protein